MPASRRVFLFLGGEQVGTPGTGPKRQPDNDRLLRVHDVLGHLRFQGLDW
jgi:hypothetical protein